MMSTRPCTFLKLYTWLFVFIVRKHLIFSNVYKNGNLKNVFKLMLGMLVLN